MQLDPEQLRRDVEARRAERDRGLGPSGRPRTGAIATIRQNLATIETLRADGATWADIASAVTAQGLLRGDGKPLTGRHVTAINCCDPAPGRATRNGSCKAGEPGRPPERPHYTAHQGGFIESDETRRTSYRVLQTRN